jgi:hypothetical protein
VCACACACACACVCGACVWQFRRLPACEGPGGYTFSTSVLYVFEKFFFSWQNVISSISQSIFFKKKITLDHATIMYPYQC